MYVIDYDCLTAAGPTREDLMKALYQGQVCSRKAQENEWSTPVIPGGLVALIKGEEHLSRNSEKSIAENLSQIWQNIFKRLPAGIREEMGMSRVGLIFSSTKGCVEDYISETTSEQIRSHQDPYIDICEDFSQLNPEFSFKPMLTLSNACSSSHVALEYAQDLFQVKRLDYVILIAADLVGPFVYNGFNSLKVLSHTQNLPFSKNRDGLQLGEALSLLFLSRDKKNSDLKISSVASDTEGSSITRPSVNGQGLVRTLMKIKNSLPHLKPDLVIAHGTGTKFNDQAEDQALDTFLSEIELKSTPITNTKWSIGHTLGASGSVDLIAACEILKKQKVFSIASHDEQDPRLMMNYLLGSKTISKELNQILITSLGFGSIHASLLLEKTSS